MESDRETVMLYDAAAAVGRWIGAYVREGQSDPEAAIALLNHPDRLVQVLDRKIRDFQNNAPASGPAIDLKSLEIVREELSAPLSYATRRAVLMAVIRHYRVSLKPWGSAKWRCGYCGMDNSSGLLVCTNCGR